MTYTNPEKAGLEAGLKKDLQSSHFRFNEVKTNQFKTVTQTSFPNKLEAARELNRINQADLLSDLTKTHFTIGNTGVGGMATENRSSYANPHGNPAVLDANRSRDLRSHHHNFGDGVLQDKTTYREEYFWKVNQNKNPSK